MKISIVFSLACFAICFFTTSCTKTEIQTKTVTVTDTLVKTVTDTVVKIDTLKPAITPVGFWVGTYQVTGSPTTYYMSFDLRPDGVLLWTGIGADANTYYGEGTYTVNGTNFSYTFTTLNLSQNGTIQNSTGSYTAATGIITGSWANQGTLISGTYTVTKTQ
jgi:hypothetical protein